MGWIRLTHLLRQIDKVLEACGTVVQQHLEDGLLAPLLGKGTYKFGRVLVELSGLLVDQRWQSHFVAKAAEG